MKKEIRDRLKMRAVVMAKEPEQKNETTAIIQIIEFNLASEIYGIETDFIKEVYPLKDFTTLPGLPPFIIGIGNLRGQIIPILDLKKFFNLPASGLGDLNKVIILRNEHMEFGVLADAVNRTNTIYKDDVLPAPQSVTGIGEKYLKGVTKDRVIILSAENMLSDKGIIVHDEVK